jgi:hypothetical protein
MTSEVLIEEVGFGVAVDFFESVERRTIYEVDSWTGLEEGRELVLARDVGRRPASEGDYRRELVGVAYDGDPSRSVCDRKDVSQTALARFVDDG